MAVEIEKLFHLKRFNSLNTLTFLLFMVYVPIGCAFLLLRILMSLQYVILISILPKNWLIRRILMRVYLFFMGIVVTTGGNNFQREEAMLLISNHVSHVDAIALEAVVPSCRVDALNLPPLLNYIMGWHNEADLHKSHHCYSFFPEEDTTNGKVGILKFSKTTFDKKIYQQYSQTVIQPVVIMANRPWFIPVNVNTLFSTFLSDLLWCLFVPFTQFHISFIPARELEKNADEKTKEDFIEKLQKDMAYVLAIETSSISAKDKNDYLKKLRHEENMKFIQQQQTFKENNSHRTSQRRQNKYSDMVEQVKVVLPQVPIAVVNNEIARTKNVDETISNLLDGSVMYKPLSDDELLKEKEDLKQIKKVTTLKSNFGQTSEDRHLSYQDRKKKMTSIARRKYLEKHPEYM